MKNVLQKKFLILGAKGQLGKAFVDYLSAKAPVVAPPEEEADITQHSRIQALIEESKPDVVINCAAYNAVDEAQDHEDIAFKVNAQGVEHLAELSKTYGFFLVHYSSDYVFDGAKGLPYTEEDAPFPLNVYGKSKLEGEKCVLKISPHYLVFRLSWVIGPGKQNFLFKLTQWAQKNHVLKVSSDEISVPTFTDTIVEVTLKSLEAGLSGLFHLTNSGMASRYELAKEFLKEIKMPNEVLPCSMPDFLTKARRPKFSAMDNKKISSTLGIHIKPWKEALAEYVAHGYGC